MNRQAIFPHRLVAAFSCYGLFLNEILTFSQSKEPDVVRVPYINNATAELKGWTRAHSDTQNTCIYMHTRRSVRQSSFISVG